MRQLIKNLIHTDGYKEGLKGYAGKRNPYNKHSYQYKAWNEGFREGYEKWITKEGKK